MNPDNPDKPCRRLLEWRYVPAPDADLARRVQRDIAASRQRARGVMPLRFALTSVALGMLLGVAAVEWYHFCAKAAGTPDMPQLYLVWIDPMSASKGIRP